MPSGNAYVSGSANNVYSIKTKRPIGQRRRARKMHHVPSRHRKIG
jgi:hypothetical protein